MVDPYSSRARVVLSCVAVDKCFNSFLSAGIINQYSTATKMPEHLLEKRLERSRLLFKPEVRMRFDTKMSVMTLGNARD